MSERAADLEARFGALRQAIVCEPRGHDAIVGALLTPPVSPAAVAGVIFFNNVGLLGMCGHGVIGVVQTLRATGQASREAVHLDTPVGPVSAHIDPDGAVTIRNVPARARQLDVALEVPGHGRIHGDVAWGGNWFFITSDTPAPLTLAHHDELLRFTQAVRRALAAQHITGDDGAEIDHVELTVAAALDAQARALTPGGDEGGRAAGARCFVLCPGGAYDRSPCGTGTSAKLAVLHARGLIAVREQWQQESITGGRFTAWLEADGDDLVPHVRGRAFVIAESVLRFDAQDPFRAGFTAAQP
jgi:proline racemase